MIQYNTLPRPVIRILTHEMPLTIEVSIKHEVYLIHQFVINDINFMCIDCDNTCMQEQRIVHELDLYKVLSV